MIPKTTSETVHLIRRASYPEPGAVDITVKSLQQLLMEVKFLIHLQAHFVLTIE